jgi:hypothetical protein
LRCAKACGLKRTQAQARALKIRRVCAILGKLRFIAASPPLIAFCKHAFACSFRSLYALLISPRALTSSLNRKAFLVHDAFTLGAVYLTLSQRGRRLPPFARAKRFWSVRKQSVSGQLKSRMMKRV